MNYIPVLVYIFGYSTLAFLLTMLVAPAFCSFLTKNRFVKQYLEGEMYLSFENGLNKYYGLLELAVGFGIIIQTGSTYTLPDGTKLGYYSKWKTNNELWEKTIIPGIEAKINVEWKYGNNIGKEENIPDEVEEKE